MRTNVISLISATSLFFILASVGATVAATELEDDGAFPQNEDVVAIRLILTPIGLMTRAPLTEVNLPKVGCVVEVKHDMPRTESLLEILRRHTRLSSEGETTFQLRNAVYMHLKNGSVAKVLLGEVNADANVIYGNKSNGQGIKSAPILADKNIYRKLIDWAQLGEPGSSHSKSCTFGK